MVAEIQMCYIVITVLFLKKNKNRTVLYTTCIKPTLLGGDYTEVDEILPFVQKQCKALYDYVANAPDEITFKYD